MATYAIGDRVAQPQYGPGTITYVDQHQTVIDFDEHGVRTFVTPMVVLERTASPAPARTAASRRKARASTSKS